MATILKSHQPFMNLGMVRVPKAWEMWIWYSIAFTKTILNHRAYENKYIHPYFTCLLFCVLSITYNTCVEITELTVTVMVPYCAMITFAICNGYDVSFVPLVMILAANFYPPLEFIWDLYLIMSTTIELVVESNRTRSVTIVCSCLWGYFLCYLKTVGEVVTVHQENTRFVYFNMAGVFLFTFLILGLFASKLKKVTVYAVAFNLAILMMYLM